MVIHRDVLLAAIALASALIFGGNAPAAPAPAPAPPSAAPRASASQLPPTQPGLSRDEGVFLVTTAGDGSRAVYFIAGNSRHSILWTDVQTELQLNPLWPVFDATPDQVEAFAEGAPIGAAHTGLLGGGDAPEADAPAPPSPPEPDVQPAAADDSEPTTYTLRPGDNLTRIAAQFGTSVDAILAANGVSNPNRIYAGQSIVIPSGDDTSLADAPAVDDTSVADAPVAENDGSDDASASADDSATTYTVQRGDSAFKIARRFGVDQAALLDANGITNPNRVYVGQVLTIPGASS